MNPSAGARLVRSSALLTCVAVASACGDAKSVFIGNRLRDDCNGNWPVCTTAAGCVVGNGQYIPGTFPGTLRTIVQLTVPTTVEIDIFLTTEGAVGSETDLIWNEPGCGQAFRDPINGKDLFAQFDSAGQFTDSHELYESGDHLIEVNSDATANYVLKLNLTPGP